ncbi:MAG TPA: TonB family protein [Candidatus Acidoferrales bacterium]|nr:TonB family protein [Candidatus Acidoferrales bacterium]
MAEPMQSAVKRVLVPVEETFLERPSHSKLPGLDLGVDWGSPWQEFWSSWRTYFSRERAPEDAELPADSDLRVEWIQGKFPGRAFTAAALWHVAAIAIILLPIWHFLASDPPNLAPVRIELTWTNPSQDLPPISLPGHDVKPSPRGDPAKPLPRKGADAFHPRQTILSEPAQLTHPRQTLIQPDAPATPPKIETPLPNIAEWAASPAPPKPQLHLGSAAAAPEMRHRATADLTAPEVNQEKNAGPLDIAASPTMNFQPRMPVEPMSKAVAARHASQGDTGAAPEVAAASAGDVNLHRLIAISAAPAPPAPEVSVPQGNLAARISISPDGKQPGVPGGAENGPAGNGGAGGPNSSGGGRGTSATAGGSAGSSPAAVSISGGSGHSGSGGLAPANGRTATKLNLKPLAPAEGIPAPHNGPSVIGAIDPNLPPEKILSGKEVYTMHINMPNLTSISGTNWIMNFAQLEEGNPPYVKPKGALTGLELIRKVDPKYPQTLIKENVDGEVILYAIIRKDGTVDSIQVVRGVDPQLDRNAIEALSRWEFRPALRDGQPVDLEAVVRIPFHFRKPE